MQEIEDFQGEQDFIQDGAKPRTQEGDRKKKRQGGSRLSLNRCPPGEKDDRCEEGLPRGGFEKTPLG